MNESLLQQQRLIYLIRILNADSVNLMILVDVLYVGQCPLTPTIDVLQISTRQMYSCQLRLIQSVYITLGDKSSMNFAISKPRIIINVMTLNYGIQV